MSRITEALKKAQEERNLERRAQELKSKKDRSLSEKSPPRPHEMAATPISGGKAKPQMPKQPSLELSLEERLGRRYIARATDDSGIDPRIIAYFDPTSAISEQYRILRTNIQSNNSPNPLKTIVVSSALHGEGKSITAVNLAVTMARDLDKTVLLGDCDLRHGGIHQLLALNPTQGMADALVDGFSPEQAFCKTRIDNLTILPRGNIPHNPSELLGSKKMRRLLEELKSRFDYIILDSPPIVPLTDSGLLGSKADGVILVIQAHKTQQKVVEQAQALLKQAGARVLGLVLTSADYFVPKYLYRYIQSS